MITKSHLERKGRLEANSGIVPSTVGWVKPTEHRAKHLNLNEALLL
jgi:hypothetical protein